MKFLTFGQLKLKQHYNYHNKWLGPPYKLQLRAVEIEVVERGINFILTQSGYDRIIYDRANFLEYIPEDETLVRYLL